MIFLLKMHGLSLVIIKYQEKPKLRKILQTNWLVLFSKQTAKVMKTLKIEELFRISETKEIQ